MPTPKRFAPLSDTELLRRVLRHANLAEDQRGILRVLLNALLGGRLEKLKPTDRIWVQSAYDEQDIGELLFRARQRARKKVDDHSEDFDALPRPKQPPGR